jgi:heptosyltransferase III
VLKRFVVARVLIIFPGALGDLICVGPALAAIRARHPETKIELMAREELAKFAVGRMGIDRAHSIDRREVSDLFSESPDAFRLREFFGEFDRICSFFAFEDPRYRRNLSAVSNAVSFYRFRPDTSGHVAAAYLGEIGESSNANPTVTLTLTPDDLASAERAIAGIAERRGFVAILPGSGSPSKNWPLDRFLELAKRMEHDGARAVFILGPAENGMAEAIRKSGADAILESLPLGTVAALARLSWAFIGCDSGVSHLAAAAGAPGIVLFGSTDPNRWRPLGNVRIIHQALDTIEPDHVLAQVQELKRERGAIK